VQIWDAVGPAKSGEDALPIVPRFSRQRLIRGTASLPTLRSLPITIAGHSRHRSVDLSLPIPQHPHTSAARRASRADTMPVSLKLKRQGAYTNLDFVEGDVHLDINSSETIESIVVKAEGK